MGSGTKGMMAIHSRIGKNTTSKKPVNVGNFNNIGLELDSPKLNSSLDPNEFSMTQDAAESFDKLNVISNRLRKQEQEKLVGNHPVSASKPGGQIFEEVQLPRLDKSEYPETALDSSDYAKRLRFEELKRTKLEEMCSWKQKDVKGIKKNAYIKEIQKKNEKILSVADKDELERLEVMTDRFPLLEVRKAISKFQILVKMVCKFIIETSMFDNATTGVILVNSAAMMFDNPANKNPEPIFAILENYFLILYTIEMVLKILGMGFILGPNTYLKDSWNILDFTIVVSSLLSLESADAVEKIVPIGQEEEQGFSM